MQEGGILLRQIWIMYLAEIVGYITGREKNEEMNKNVKIFHKVLLSEMLRYRETWTRKDCRFKAVSSV